MNSIKTMPPQRKLAAKLARKLAALTFAGCSRLKVGRKVGEPTSQPPTLPTMALFTSPGRESPPVRPVVPVFNVLVLLVDTFCAVRARTLSLCSCVPPTVQNGCRRNGGCWWWFAINGAKNRATGPIWWLAGGVMWWHRLTRNDVPTEGRCIP